MHAVHTLKLIRLTEKSNKLSSGLGQYTSEAVEKTFKVTVRRVNTMVCAGKNKKSRQGRPSMTSEYKKAVVTLKAGDKIELV